MSDKRNLKSITIDEVKELIDLIFKTDIDKETININTDYGVVEIFTQYDKYYNIFINIYKSELDVYLEDYGGHEESMSIPFSVFKYIEERFDIKK